MTCACSSTMMGMGMGMMDCGCGAGKGCTCAGMGSSMMGGMGMMGGMMMPKICMYMTDDKMCCCLMMPGCKKDDISMMMMADSTLLCMGKMSKPDMFKSDDGHMIVKEFAWGTYERKMVCPMGVKMDQCKMMCTDGMCMIEMPCPKGSMMKPE